MLKNIDNLECFWNTEKLNNQTSVGLQGKKIKDYLRFDVHIIDKKTGKWLIIGMG